jgi:hypothetical protein
MTTEYSEILDFVFSSGQITSGNDKGEVDADEVEACVRFEAEERGLNADEAWKFAKSHIKAQ